MERSKHVLEFPRSKAVFRLRATGVRGTILFRELSLGRNPEHPLKRIGE
jgi:hypothetical protein